MRRTYLPAAACAVIGLALAANACSDDGAAGVPPAASPGGTGGGACVADGECGQDICVDGACVTRDGRACADNAQCAADRHCASGACEAGAPCTANADCARGESCREGGCAPDARRPCADASECRSGEACADGFCEGGDGGTEADCLAYAPEATEDPADPGMLRGALQFGSTPSIGDVRVAEVTVTNTCDRTVRVLQASRESATSLEFSVETDRVLPVDLARGEQVRATVTYAPVDLVEETSGQFVAVLSDDSHPTARYELQVEYKGTSALALTDEPAATAPNVASHNFGPVAVGQVGRRVLFLKNAGSGNHLLHVRAISTTSGTPFTVTPGLALGDEPVVLPPFRGCLVDADCAAGNRCDTASGGVCRTGDGRLVDVVELEVEFTPVAARPETAELELVHDAGGAGAPGEQRFVVVLTGGGGNPPTLVLNPSLVEFGEVEVRTVRTDEVRIENAGDQDLTVGNLRMAGLSSPEFTVSPLAIPSIPAGGFQLLTVQYAPVPPGIGTDVALLELDSNDPNAPGGQVSISGTATDPEARATPADLDFGPVWPGDPPARATVRVTNEGFGSLQVTDVRISAGSAPAFTVVAVPVLPFELPDRATELALDVEFAPLSPGQKTGAVEILTSDNDNPVVTVTLAGEGLSGGRNPPTIVLVPGAVSFGDVELGQTATLSLQVENAGDQDLLISNLRMAPLSSAELTVSPLSLPAIPAGGFQTLLVQYAPVGPTTGADAGLLQLDTNDPAAPVAQVAIDGRAIDPRPQVSPASLDLGSIRPGSPAATGTITVTNGGLGLFTVTAVRLSAGTDPAFTIPSPPALPFDLPDGAGQVSITVEFAPATPGTKSGAVDIVTTDRDMPLLTVALLGSGRADPPAISFNPTAVDFGDVELGTTASRQLRVENAGGQDLVVGNIRFGPLTSGEFSIAPQAVPAIAPGAFQTLTVTYAPVGPTTGADAGIVLMDTNDPANPAPSVQLAGVSTDPELAATPSALDLGIVRPGDPPTTATVRLSNAGLGLLTITEVRLAAGSDAAFTVPTAPVLPANLPDGSAFVDVTVRFDPATAGAKTGALEVLSSDRDQPVLSVPLTGAGRSDPPAFDVQPAAVDFGTVDVGTTATRVLTISNLGGQDLVITNLRLGPLSSPEFTFTPPSLPAIAPGAFQQVVVEYAPVGPQLGQDAGSLQLDTNDPLDPAPTIQLAGVSTDAVAQVTPASLDLGGVWPGDPAATGSVTVRNTGLGLLTVTAVRLRSGTDPSFSIPAPPSLPFDLPDGTAQLDVTVSFAPGTPGVKTGALELDTTDRDNPTLTVPLTGTGLDCTCTIPGASWVCDHGACNFVGCLPGYWDVDVNLANGCEYACSVSGADVPDDSFLDADCDGIDGSALDAIFVAAGGADANPGTRAQPMRTIDAAIVTATSQGKDVFIAGGTYFQPSTLVLVDGVSLYGAYSAADWSRSDLNVTELSGPAKAVSASGLSTQTVIDHLTIRGASTSSAGASAYGIFAVNSPGLVVRRSIVEAGRGGNGTNGSSPGGSAPDGGAGNTGSPGCEDSGFGCSSCSQPGGGAGGATSCGAGSTITGGAGGSARKDGNSGLAGSPGNGGAAGGPGTPARNGDWDTPSTYWGAGGANGGNGTNGPAGAPAWLSTGYGPSNGASGAAGSNGRGGGGGGGGGGGETNCNSYGGAGGGGGGGGCGGLLATGGSSGGGSFAIYLWASSARIEACELRTGGGGNGGTGGTGQPGGSGGEGGHGTRYGAGNSYGGSSEQDDGSNGGRGGWGGNGGRGGHGGGGAGGPTAGVLSAGGSAPVQSANTYVLGPAGSGGVSAGNDGSNGASGNTLVR